MSLIVVPDLGIGNYASVLRMVEKVGGGARIVKDPAELKAGHKIILAGVGAFDRGAASLREGGWIEPLENARAHGTPVLGICLGMQLLCARSEEGTLPGLGWIDAEVRRFRSEPGAEIKIPHMGWNTVTVLRANPLLPTDAEEQRFYFVHSYVAVCASADDIVATAHHGDDFVAALARDNVYGVQFHPEKSHRFGMELIRRFREL